MRQKTARQCDRNFKDEPMAKMGSTVLNVICLMQYRCFPNNTCTVSVCPNKATHSSNSRGGWLFVLPKSNAKATAAMQSSTNGTAWLRKAVKVMLNVMPAKSRFFYHKIICFCFFEKYLVHDNGLCRCEIAVTSIGCAGVFVSARPFSGGFIPLWPPVRRWRIRCCGK